ncbi:MAG: hypothetical protein LBT65_08145 [Synergistaceae bacterium]|nr:hypothetical protein [Synergistaceae bacterium]
MAFASPGPSIAAEGEAIETGNGRNLPIALVASPDQPFRGETVVITADVPGFDAALQGIHWSWKGDAANLRPLSDTEVAWRAGRDPATISATLWDRVGGGDLTTASLSVTPRVWSLEIRISNPADAKILLWDDASKSMRESEDRAVNSAVGLEAIPKPRPADDVRYVWSSDEDTVLDSRTKNRAVARRVTTGTSLVSLRLVDGEGLELGNARVSFDVSISSEELDRGVRLQNGWKRWEAAFALREGGEAESALIQARLAAEELIGAGLSNDALRDDLERFARERNNALSARALSSAAATLWRDGRQEEALMQYRQAQTLRADPMAEQSIAELEAILHTERERRDKAGALAEEAAAAMERGNFEEAVAKYEESLRLFPNPAVRAARLDAEARLRALRRKIDEAKMAREIALALEVQGDLENALAKMSESRETFVLPETAAEVERIRSALRTQQNRRNEASRLSTEAATLEMRGLEDQGSVEILEQALAKYQQAAETWPDTAESSMSRVRTHIARLQAQVAQVALLVEEAERLEAEERLEEAMDRYRRAQAVRLEADVRDRMTVLARRIETRNQRILEAKELYERAFTLEKQGRLDEALPVARRGREAFAGGDLSIMIQRLEKLIETRDGKTARAAELAVQARQAQAEGNLERSLDLFIESNSVWNDNDVARSIQTLRGLVSEDIGTVARAAELYDEAVILERESKLDVAEEKLRASLALASGDEAAQLLSKVQKARTEAAWADNLELNPPVLRVVPPVPRRGQRTIVRIDSGGAEGARYRWSVEGAVRNGNPGKDGRTYSFYPAADRPVTVTLSVTREGTDREFMTRSLSLITEPHSVSLAANEATKNAQLWDETLKRLVDVHEFPTGTDIGIRAEISPLPDGPVSWTWSVDPDSVVLSSGDRTATARRLLPGTMKLSAAARDSRGIVLGEAALSLPVMLDKNEVARDARRAKAWSERQTAKRLWDEGKCLQALETAAAACLLDPGDPELALGLTKMREDLEKMERAARLLSDSSWLLSAGRADEAANRALEADALVPGSMTPEMKRALREADERARLNATLAARLRSEGEAFLQRGRTVEALLRLQDSLLIEDNDVVSRDAARLTRELEEERARLREAGDLRMKGNALAEGKRYINALELYAESLALFPDPWLEAWMGLLREKAEDEKVARERAVVLRAEADALMKGKKTTEALEKYRESLRVWQDDDVEKIVRAEENRIAQAEASKLRREAEALIKRKRNAEALAKYRESLKYAFNETADAYTKKADAAEAKALTKEGDTLLTQKNPDEALKRYRIALAKTPDDETLIEKIRKLELILTPTPVAPPSDDIVPVGTTETFPSEFYAETSGDLISSDGSSRDLVQADALFREGNTFYRGKKYREALTRYRESYKFSQSQQLKEFADQLELALNNMEKANKLVHEGNAFYRNKKYDDALTRYRESLKFYKNPEVEAFIPRVEAQIGK